MIVAMGIMEDVVERVAAGHTVEFACPDGAGAPPLRGGRRVVVAPAGPARIAAGDIVLARDGGAPGLHQVTAVDRDGHRVRFGAGDWTGGERVFGVCVAVDGAPRSARLDLLPLRAGHADEMARVLADPALHAFTGGRPDTAGELRARYTRVLAGSPDPAVSWLNWVLRLRDEGCLTGYVQATISPGAAGPEAEIAWVVGTPWKGRGLAGEAARALTGWLDSRGVRTVVAHIHPDHHASASVARACGLTPTGHLQDGERRWQRDVPEGIPETA